MPTVGHVRDEGRVHTLHSAEPSRFIDVHADTDGHFVVRFARADFYADVIGAAPRRHAATVDLVVSPDRTLRLCHDARERPVRLGTAQELRWLTGWSPLGFEDLHDAGGVECAAWDEMWARAAAHLDTELVRWALGGDPAQSGARYNTAVSVERFAQLVRSTPLLAHLVYQLDVEGVLPGAARDSEGLLALSPLEVIDRFFTCMRGARLPRGVTDPPLRATTPILKKWLKADPTMCTEAIRSVESAYTVCAALNATTTEPRRLKDGTTTVEERPVLDVNGLPKLGQDRQQWTLFHTAAEISVELAAAVLKDPAAADRSVSAFGAATLQLARTDPERAALEAGQDAEQAALQRGETPEEAARAADQAVDTVRRTASHTVAAARATARTITRLADGRGLCDWVLREVDAWQHRPEATADERLRSATLGFARQAQAAEEWRRRVTVVLDEELSAYRERRRERRLQRVAAPADRDNDIGRRHQEYAEDIPDEQPFPVPVSPLEMRIVTANGTAYLMRWLQNRGELKRESEIMNHCVGRHFYYAQRAMAGQSFIYTGLEEQTGRTIFTAEFDDELRVVQVQGYSNYVRRPPEDCRPAIEEALAPFRVLAREARDLLDAELTPEMAQHAANFMALREAHEQRLAAVRAENEARAAEIRQQAEEHAAAEVAAMQRRERDAEALAREFEF
jgi:hypothetical protein